MASAVVLPWPGEAMSAVLQKVIAMVIARSLIYSLVQLAVLPSLAGVFPLSVAPRRPWMVALMIVEVRASAL